MNLREMMKAENLKRILFDKPKNQIEVESDSGDEVRLAYDTVEEAVRKAEDHPSDVVEVEIEDE